eukprot:6469161-Amphidinium_carterae.1
MSTWGTVTRNRGRQQPAATAKANAALIAAYQYINEGSGEGRRPLQQQQQQAPPEESSTVPRYTQWICPDHTCSMPNNVNRRTCRSCGGASPLAGGNLVSPKGKGKGKNKGKNPSDPARQKGKGKGPGRASSEPPAPLSQPPATMPPLMLPPLSSTPAPQSAQPSASEGLSGRPLPKHAIVSATIRAATKQVEQIQNALSQLGDAESCPEVRRSLEQQLAVAKAATLDPRPAGQKLDAAKAHLSKMEKKHQSLLDQQTKLSEQQAKLVEDLDVTAKEVTLAKENLVKVEQELATLVLLAAPSLRATSLPLPAAPSSNLSIGDLMHVQTLLTDVRKFVAPSVQQDDNPTTERERSPRGLSKEVADVIRARLDATLIRFSGEAARLTQQARANAEFVHQTHHPAAPGQAMEVDGLGTIPPTLPGNPQLPGGNATGAGNGASPTLVDGGDTDQAHQNAQDRHHETAQQTLVLHNPIAVSATPARMGPPSPLVPTVD